MFRHKILFPDMDEQTNLFDISSEMRKIRQDARKQEINRASEELFNEWPGDYENGDYGDYGEY